MFKKEFILLILLVLFGLVTVCYEQDMYRVDRTNPHIYLSLETTDSKKVSLTLHNNSVWPIQVCVRTYYPDPLLERKVVDNKELSFLETE